MYSTNSMIGGAVIYRKKNGVTKWFLAKSDEDGGWELPKRLVRTGESSVQAAIRYVRDDGGIRVTVLEEAGRMNVSASVKGKPTATKLLFYLMRGKYAKEEGLVYFEGEWMPYSSARRRLSLLREKKVLGQANMVLRRWRKEKGKSA
jgi:ADP-ribose pyrophosphatase YjhB (NUDIX family)